MIKLEGDNLLFLVFPLRKIYVVAIGFAQHTPCEVRLKNENTLRQEAVVLDLQRTIFVVGLRSRIDVDISSLAEETTSDRR